MGLPSAAALREHLRHVWRQASVAGVTPAQYLNELADVALQAEREGRQITAAGSGGTSVSYLVFQHFRPSDVLELIDALREPCEAATLEAALTALGAEAITSYRPDFSGAQLR